mmetsp:Transcript_20462/g.43897  ORF Transcript_20462/g.43897 Transcript_20462/m.43897 type:complete len:218 (-) Transcript_20462:775-1428(-)
MAGYLKIFQQRSAPVGDGHLQRIQDRERPRALLIQHLPHAILQYPEIDVRVRLGYSHSFAEQPDGRGGHASPAQPRQGGHARVVPPGDVRVLDELDELSFGQDGVFQIQSTELDLPRRTADQPSLDYPFRHPIVQRTVVLELQCAQRVRDSFHGIGYRVGKIVHRIDAPLVSRGLVRLVLDPVQHGIAEVEVRRGHVDLGSQDVRSVLKVASPHLFK